MYNDSPPTGPTTTGTAAGSTTADKWVHIYSTPYLYIGICVVVHCAMLCVYCGLLLLYYVPLYIICFLVVHYAYQMPYWGVHVQCLVWKWQQPSFHWEANMTHTCSCWEVSTFLSFILACTFVLAFLFILECFIHNDRPITEKETNPTNDADSTTTEK